MSIKIYNLNDYIISALIIIMLAFKDYSQIYLIVSICSFVFCLLSKIKKNTITYDKRITSFIGNKLLFLGYCLIISLFCNYASNSYKVILGTIIKLINSATLLLYVDNEEKMDKITKIVVLSSILLCIRLIINVPLTAFGKERIGIYLAHNSENSYGYTGITYVLGFSIIILLTKNDILKSNRLKWILLIVFCIFSILSGSKKQIFLLVITMTIITLYNSHNLKKLISSFIVSITSIAILSYAIFSNQYLYDAIGVRLIGMYNFFLTEGGNSSDTSTLGRANFLEEAKHVFKEHPIIGVGLDNFKFYNLYSLCWAENNYYELLADTGFIGFCIYYYIYIIVLFDVFRRRKDKNNNNLTILSILTCYLFVDYTMVTYAAVVLQFYFTYCYCLNMIEKNKFKKMEMRKYDS